MSYQPHLSRGGELYHGRKAISEGGSPNGFSKTPGYTAKGKKRVGRFVGYSSNGTPIYDYGQKNASTVRSYEQQQRINAAVATNAGTKGQSARELRQRHADAEAVARGKSSGAPVLVERKKNIFERAGSAISGAAGSARNWLGKRASDISGYAKRARTAIGNAWDGKAGAGSAKDDADLYRSYEQRNIKAGNKDKAVGYHKKASNAQGAYDRSIVGRLNNARNNVGNWLNERASDISGYAKRARTAIGNAWDGKAGAGSAKDDADLYRSYEQRNIKAGNKDKAVGYHKKASNAQGAYDRSIVGTATRLLNRAGSAVRGAGEAISSGARRVGKAASDSYVRSGASNTTRTLMTKGPVQVVKNQLNASGGREGQQAKGNKTNMQNSQRSAQERKQYIDQVTRTWGGVQRRYDMLSDKVDNAKNENERMRAQEKLDKYTKETYIPAWTTYNNVVKNKKK